MIESKWTLCLLFGLQCQLIIPTSSSSSGDDDVVHNPSKPEMCPPSAAKEESAPPPKRVIQQKQPTKQSLELVEWLKKMTTTEHMLLLDPNPMDSEAEELLSSCMNDRFNLTGSLHEDEMGKISGKGTVVFTNGSSCHYMNIRSVAGTFREGKLTGEGVITHLDDSYTKAMFRRGVLHGLFRRFRCQFGLCDEFDYEPWRQPKHLGEISWYRNGHRIGATWEFKAGGGAVVGMVNEDGELTGADITYVYLDKWVLLVGEFQKGVMVAARESRLAGLRFTEEEIALPLAMSPWGPIYTYEPSNSTHLVSNDRNLLLRDPYEEQFMTVGESTMAGAGNGIFLQRDVKMGMLLGFYGGVRMQDTEARRGGDRKSQYRIDNDWAVPYQVIDIPKGYRDPKNYSATLGHILNHSKTPNAWYGMVDHPRFGAIRSIVALHDMKAGVELFCNYGYLETFVKSEMAANALIETVMNVGSAFFNKEKGAFGDMLKDTIKNIKTQVVQFQSNLDTAAVAGGSGGAEMTNLLN